MKFDRTDLITRAEAEIQRRKTAAAERDEQAAKDAAAERQEWMDTKAPHFVVFANRIKDKIRKGRPIVTEDVPPALRARYSDIEFFTPPRITAHPAATATLEQLVAVLSAVTDDEVTSAGLVQLGFRDLTRLFQ